MNPVVSTNYIFLYFILYAYMYISMLHILTCVLVLGCIAFKLVNIFELLSVNSNKKNKSLNQPNNAVFYQAAHVKNDS